MGNKTDRERSRWYRIGGGIGSTERSRLRPAVGQTRATVEVQAPTRDAI